MYSDVAEEILETIPLAISVQNPDRSLIYENRAMKELFGHAPRKMCYNRWDYLEKEGDHPCQYCPAYSMVLNKKPGRVVVKRNDIHGKEGIFEISHYPVIDEQGKLVKYIEVIENITDKVFMDMASENLDKVLSEEIFISIVRFGNLGGEVVITEDLPYVEYPKEFLIKESAFWIAAVGQGNYLNEGLYGPLPVLDLAGIVSLGFSKVMHSESSDVRFKGKDYVFLLIFSPEKYLPLFSDREKITNLLNETLDKMKTSENLVDIDLKDLKLNLFSVIQDSIFTEEKNKITLGMLRRE